MTKIGLKLIRELEAEPTPLGTACIADAALPGFYLKRSPTSMSYFYQYRMGGRGAPTIRYKIGDYPSYTPDQARREALQLRAKVQGGIDPRKEKRDRQIEELRERTNSFSAIFAIYEDQHLSQNRSKDDVKAIFIREFIPSLGRIPLAQVERTEVGRIVSNILKRGHGQSANLALRVLKAFLNWAVSSGYIEINPIAGMKPPYKDAVSRTRVLDHGEIKRFWDALDSVHALFAAAYKVLLLTGQRRSEVAEMRWQDIDFRNALWTIPADVAKNTHAHTVPLTPLVLEILLSVHAKYVDGLYVFSTNGRTPISGWSKIKKDLDEVSGVKGWRTHDLRRTAATGMGDLGFDMTAIGMVLNHKYQGVTAVYNRSSYLRSKKRVLNTWENALAGIVEGQQHIRQQKRRYRIKSACAWIRLHRLQQDVLSAAY